MSRVSTLDGIKWWIHRDNRQQEHSTPASEEFAVKTDDEEEEREKSELHKRRRETDTETLSVCNSVFLHVFLLPSFVPSVLTSHTCIPLSSLSALHPHACLFLWGNNRPTAGCWFVDPRKQRKHITGQSLLQKEEEEVEATVLFCAVALFPSSPSSSSFIPSTSCWITLSKRRAEKKRGRKVEKKVVVVYFGADSVCLPLDFRSSWSLSLIFFHSTNKKKKQSVEEGATTLLTHLLLDNNSDRKTDKKNWFKIKEGPWCMKRGQKISKCCFLKRRRRRRRDAWNTGWNLKAGQTLLWRNLEFNSSLFFSCKTTTTTTQAKRPKRKLLKKERNL